MSQRAAVIVPDSVFVVIAGGGTMGHVTPGLAVAGELLSRGLSKDQIHFVGSSRGVEAKVIPAAGFPLTLLPGRGVQRRFALANFGAITGILMGVARAVILVRKLAPKVILSTGGYASVPCVVAAKLWRVPVVVAESNAIAGAANRFASRVAKVSAVAFAEAALPRQVVTGNPVRDEILAVARSDKELRKARARAQIGVETTGPLLVAFGGSLGARRINQAVLALAELRPELSIYHVIGHRDWAMFAKNVAELRMKNPSYVAVEYEHHMEQALAAADLVVCRSGATTVAEIAAIGVASILVPLPIATQDHQTANAKALTSAGAAISIPDSELNVKALSGRIDELIENEAQLAAMALQAESLALLDAANRVADLIQEHARND